MSQARDFAPYMRPAYLHSAHSMAEGFRQTRELGGMSTVCQSAMYKKIFRTMTQLLDVDEFKRKNRLGFVCLMGICLPPWKLCSPQSTIYNNIRTRYPGRPA